MLAMSSSRAGRTQIFILRGRLVEPSASHRD
jgi:hypothetical protein